MFLNLQDTKEQNLVPNVQNVPNLNLQTLHTPILSMVS